MTLRRFLIERAIPEVGSFEREQPGANYCFLNFWRIG